MNINPNYVRIPEMGSANPDELFVCPYDPMHRVAAKRFPYHIMKCRKNWVGRGMSTCPFNARHIVPQPEFRHHVANCPDKCMIEMDIAFMQRNESQDGSYMKGCTDIPAYNRKIPSPTEDWDREISAGDIRVGYNPDEEKEDVYRNLTGYTPQEKRDYHRRIGKVHFKNQEDLDTHVPGRRSPSPKQPTQPVHRPTPHNGTVQAASQQDGVPSSTTQQMRLPKQLPKAAEVAAAAAAASIPNGWDASKKGGRAIAANIFGPNEHQTYDSSETIPDLVSTPLADTENGYGHGSSSAFSRPLPGMGRGLIPGLGRGVLPGIGRGLLSLNSAIGLQAMEPKVGMKRAVTSN